MLKSYTNIIDKKGLRSYIGYYSDLETDFLVESLFLSDPHSLYYMHYFGKIILFSATSITNELMVLCLVLVNFKICVYEFLKNEMIPGVS